MRIENHVDDRVRVGNGSYGLNSLKGAALIGRFCDPGISAKLVQTYVQSPAPSMCMSKSDIARVCA